MFEGGAGCAGAPLLLPPISVSINLYAVTPPPEHLKIGLISPYGWSSQWGVNRHINGLAGTLSRFGHSVSVIVPAEERDTPAAEEPYRLIRVPGTLRMPYSESMANLALPLDASDRLDGLLAEEQFDILHLHEPYPPSLPFAALRLARSPVVATFHTAAERLLSFQLMRPLVERYLARLDGRICTSQYARRIISSYFPGNYEVIATGVDTGVFSPPDGSVPAGGSRPLVMFAAWGEPRKSLGLLLRAMRMLPEDIPPFDLAVVGGEELSWRSNLVVPRRLRDKVGFSGVVGAASLPEYYMRALVLIAPYATCSHSGSILEAMAGGAAIIVPGRGGIRELVGEGKEGLLLDHPYSYNLAANLVDLLVNPELGIAMGAAAAGKAVQHPWEKAGARIDSVMQSAHRRRQRPAPSSETVAAVGNGHAIFADLHTHTCYSHDCPMTPSELIAACDDAGIEAVAITDHNTIEGALEVASLAPQHLHVVIGEEIKTLDGEIIGLYLKEEIPPGLTAEETIQLIKAQGGLVYVPHPFDPLHLTPAYELLARNASQIDIIEVYNPRITFAAFNEKARRLARKYDIPAGAGSDCHVVQGVGTALLSLKRFSTPDELLASLRGAEIIRSRKSPIYLHSLKLLKNGRGVVGTRQ